MQIEVRGKPYRHSEERGKIIVAQTKKLGKGNKRMVQIKRGIEPAVWTIGFESHDHKGYVFKDPVNKEWVFFRREEEFPIYERPLTKLYSDGTPRRRTFNEALEEGMMCERELVRVLRPLVKPLNVYSLPSSGAHCGGTDVIITWHEELDLSQGRDLVRRSLYAISCVAFYPGKKSLGNIMYNTPIKEWDARCGQDGVKPIINFVQDRYTDHEKYWFIPVTSSNINLFNRKATALAKLEKYRIPVDKFVLEVSKVLDIEHVIEPGYS
jgi:hypothetical protein